MIRKKKSAPAQRLPVYTISIAARLTELPVYTLRWLEAHALLRPARSDGNQRLFSAEDIELLKEIAELLERRVNLAGIRAILRIKQTYRLERVVFHDEE